ncbi:hypothetical protein [Nitratifractor sp.]
MGHDRPLVLRDPRIRLKLKDRHLKIARGKERFVIALRHIDALYIHMRVEISLATCVKVARLVPVYLIDSRGFIRARIVPEEGTDA